MYLTYYPIGTSGHRASALMGFFPYNNYLAPNYGNMPCYPPAQMAAIPPQFAPPPVYNQPVPAPAPALAPSASSGGISAVLEYDPPQMAAFMCWCSFGMLGQNRKPTKELEASVVSILHATRLPKLTIVIALEYMNQRYAASAYVSLPELDIFVKLVVALVLANKFNDDNTFTNKSWCGASGVKINVLNVLEREWLAAVNWNLNVTNFQSNIDTLEECWASWIHNQAMLPWSQMYPGASSPYFYSPPGSVSPRENFGTFPTAPPSPTYGTENASSLCGYSLPVSASPVKFSQNWGSQGSQFTFYNHSRGHSVSYAPQQSIWAYAPSAYQAMPPRMDSAYTGFANPYYSCLATY